MNLYFDRGWECEQCNCHWRQKDYNRWYRQEAAERHSKETGHNIYYAWSLKWGYRNLKVADGEDGDV